LSFRRVHEPGIISSSEQNARKISNSFFYHPDRDKKGDLFVAAGDTFSTGDALSGEQGRLPEGNRASAAAISSMKCASGQGQDSPFSVVTKRGCGLS
jgi:hypothetical protein